MTTLRRSTTGCTLCKTRRRKCDETKPQCLWCLSSENPCNYEYVENPESNRYRVKRTKPAPRSVRNLLAGASQNATASPDGVPTPSLFVLSDYDDSAMPSRSILPRGAAGFAFVTSTSTHLLPDISLIDSSPTPSNSIQLPTSSQNTYGILPATSGSVSRGTAKLDPYEDGKEDDDPEGVRALLCITPTMDKNVKENTLPFVLQSYSQWIVAVAFEPLNVVHKMRDQVIAQFSSENTRTKAILTANVMDMFARNFTIDRARKSILDRLALNVQMGGAAFMATPPALVPALDRQNAIRILDNTIEILTLLINTRPTSHYVRLLESAAPIFRRACLDPPGRPINLPIILLDLNLNLRHFATIDILKSIITGLPTCFQYEVPFSLELCDRIYHWQLQGNYGLQWLYGLPDQFMLLIAWINSLSKIPGAGDNSELIAWIEKALPQIEVALGDSSEPALRIVRMMVLEAWRLAVQIYLYMVLGRANAHDPRVVQVQKSFMCFIEAIKPGRVPDLHLGVQLVVSGVVATKERHREVLRRRMLRVREYTVKGTSPNDILLMLEDIWARTRDEGRAAVWSDRKIAYSKLEGK